jgi:pimeloyl-ACP methyl ester carboxylesterase
MTLFPERVRAFVLDSAVIPVVDRREIVRAQTEGFERALGDFVAWCESTETCALQARADSMVLETIDSLLESADQTPITAGERVLSASDLLVALAAPLSGGARAWPYMAEAIDAVLGGDGSWMLDSADRYYGRTADGTYGDDIVDANFAIGALDAPIGLSRAEYDAFVEEEVQSLGPHFGAAIAGEVRLTVGWPFDLVRPLPAIDASRAPPALVLAGLRDPTTPARWGYELRDALANGSTVVTHDDSTHGQFLTSQCVRDLGVAFLMDPAPPPSDASCPAESSDRDR